MAHSNCLVVWSQLGLVKVAPIDHPHEWELWECHWWDLVKWWFSTKKRMGKVNDMLWFLLQIWHHHQLFVHISTAPLFWSLTINYQEKQNVSDIWSILVNILLVKFNCFLNSDCLRHRNLNISASRFWSNMDMRAGRSWELKIRISAHSFVRHNRCTWKTRVRTRKCRCSVGGLL